MREVSDEEMTRWAGELANSGYVKVYFPTTKVWDGEAFFNNMPDELYIQNNINRAFRDNFFNITSTSYPLDHPELEHVNSFEIHWERYNPELIKKVERARKWQESKLIFRRRVQNVNAWGKAHNWPEEGFPKTWDEEDKALYYKNKKWFEEHIEKENNNGTC